MHAAEANSSDSDLPSKTQTPWKESSLIQLPSPRNRELQMALAFSRLQQESLCRLGDSMAHLAHLADQSRQPETPQTERQELNRSFLEHANNLQSLTQAKFNELPVFSRNDWTVDLTPNGNKMIIPGIYRACQQAQTLQQTELLSQRSATETHQRILEVLEAVAIDQALVAEIRSRLGFALHVSQTAELARHG